MKRVAALLWRCLWNPFIFAAFLLLVLLRGICYGPKAARETWKWNW